MGNRRKAFKIIYSWTLSLSARINYKDEEQHGGSNEKKICIIDGSIDCCNVL